MKNERKYRLAFGAFALLVVAAGIVARAQFQNAPIPHNVGESITPAFEGWYRNADGTFSLSFGYMNRNYHEELDIPVGPDNRIDPGSPDQGQPTHFLPRRQMGVFTIDVPKDFGKSTVTWTLKTPGGQPIAIPGYLRPEWEIDALKEATSGNTPPVIKLDPFGPSGQGPGGTRAAIRGKVAERVPLSVTVSDDGITKRGGGGSPRVIGGRADQPPPVRTAQLGVVWSKYRGPGTVTFGNQTPTIQDAKGATYATFSEPGEYVLRVLAWDDSGGPGPVLANGFQCCWTNGYVTVTVAPAGRS